MVQKASHFPSCHTQDERLLQGSWLVDWQRQPTKPSVEQTEACALLEPGAALEL